MASLWRAIAASRSLGAKRDCHRPPNLQFLISLAEQPASGLSRRATLEALLAPEGATALAEVHVGLELDVAPPALHLVAVTQRPSELCGRRAVGALVLVSGLRPLCT